MVVSLWPVLPLLRVTKTVENAVDYSINNTARHLLWMPTSTAEKYKAKIFVDTFVVRLGDLGASGLVLLTTVALAVCGGSSHLLRVLSACNGLLCMVLWWLARNAVREHDRLSVQRPGTDPPSQTPSRVGTFIGVRAAADGARES